MTSGLRITCEEAIRRLDDYLDRELTPAAMREVEVHLRTCEYCTGKYEFDRALVHQVRGKLREVELPAALKARIGRALDMLVHGPEPDLPES